MNDTIINRCSRFLRPESTLRKAIRQADYAIEFQHDPAQIATACGAVVKLCEVEIGIRQRHKENLIAEFSLTKKNWNITGGESIPYVIAEYAEKKLRYVQGGRATLLIEAALSAYVLRGFGYDWFSTGVVSVAGTAVFAAATHGLILLITDRENKREQTERIKKRVVIPALVVTLPPLAIFLLMRVLGGGGDSAWMGEDALFLAGLLDSVFLTLATLFDLILWIATLGLIPLGAGLLAIASLYGFSEQSRDRFDQLDLGLTRLENIKAKYQAELDKVTPPDSSDTATSDTPTPPASSGALTLVPPTTSQNLTSVANSPKPSKVYSQVVNGASSLMLWLVLGLAMSLTGCYQTEGGTKPLKAVSGTLFVAAPSLSGGKTTEADTKLILMIDQSGSVRPDAAKNAAKNVHPQVPIIAEALNVSTVLLVYFSDKAWNAAEVAEFKIPPLAVPDLPAVQEKNLPPHVIETFKKRREAQLEVLRQKAVEQHRKDIQQALAKLDVASLTAAGKATVRCTDLLGLFSKQNEAKPKERHIYLIVTDGMSSCKQKTALTEPHPNITTMLLLATAVPGESRGQSDTDQYHTRKAALLKLAPWLLIVPADERDLLNRLNEKLTQPVWPMVIGQSSFKHSKQ